MTIDATTVARKVQEQLGTHGTHTRRCRVLSDEVVQQHSKDWWYVPVSIHRDQEHMWEIYESFSQIEDELREMGMEILIVPRIIPFQKWADTA